jgi:hypothetical protein
VFCVALQCAFLFFLFDTWSTVCLAFVGSLLLHCLVHVVFFRHVALSELMSRASVELFACLLYCSFAIPWCLLHPRMWFRHNIVDTNGEINTASKQAAGRCSVPCSFLFPGARNEQCCLSSHVIGLASSVFGLI